MGMRLNAVHLLSRFLPPLPRRAEMDLLTLGVQDCYFTYDRLLRFLVRHGIAHTPLDPAEVERTTGFHYLDGEERERYRDCAHQRTLFRALGFRKEGIQSMDASGFEGAEVVHDLNQPAPDGLANRFDLIYDGGTIEHVFSVKDAFSNLARMCRIGGHVIHHSPSDRLNHGFYNLNPDLLRDFYSANGFEPVRLTYVAEPNHAWNADRHYLEFEPEALPFSLQPYYSTHLHGVFRKVGDVPCRVPQQRSFAALWGGEAKKPPWRGGRFRRLLRESSLLFDLPSRLVLPWVVRRWGRKQRL